MLALKKLWRGIQIVVLVLRYALRPQWCRKLPLLRWLCWLNPYSWGGVSTSRGHLLRRMLESLGPIFVKFGQQLSTRRDLLPPDVADELERLQDRVPPFAADKARRIIERSLGGDVADLFAQFGAEPMASASIAQVHAATLHDGREVVVKVLRPRLQRRIKRDVSLMYMVARVVTAWVRDSARLRLAELVREFEYTILDELDMQREAANAATLRRNFEHSDLLYIPEVYWPYVTRDVLVLERIHGIPVNDVSSLKSHGIDLRRLAEMGVEIFFTQVFVHSFFHADMHPGNIFVSRDKAPEPQYLGVDFGIMGSLTPQDQYYLAENLLAFFKRDYRRVAQLHIDSGWVPADTRVDRFEAAIRTVCEPIFERPLEDISFARVLLRLFQVAERFKMILQPQLMLLQKTLFNVEGLGRQLYPQLNLWETAQPFLEKFVAKQRGGCAQVKQALGRLPAMLEGVTQIPPLAVTVLNHMQQQMRAHTPWGDGEAAVDGAVVASAPARSRPRVFSFRGLCVVAALLLLLWTLTHRHRPSSTVLAELRVQYLWQWLYAGVTHHGVLLAVIVLLVALLWPRNRR